jgi:hypothetical protein
MLASQSRGENSRQPDATTTRQGGNNTTTNHDPGPPGESKETQGNKKMKELLRMLKEEQTRGAEELSKAKTVNDATRVARDLLTAIRRAETIAGEIERERTNPRDDQTDKGADLQLVLAKLEAIEKRVGGGPTNRGQMTWSQVAAKGTHHPAKIELRLEEMEGADEESSEERLKRIRMAIPDARAIITHPRSTNKVSVVVKDNARRDQIMQVGIQDANGIKIIRRPNLVMVSGIPLNTPIKNGKCAENDVWIGETQKRNIGAKIERVRWLYSDKNLAARRETGTQKKGSIILSVATEESQYQLVKNGLFVGAEWHPAQLWDVSLTDGQCFKCWKWGHSQSVCNAPKELCGHCAGDHPTRDCKTQENEKASCVGCKQKGHKAWMLKACRAYQTFRSKNESTKRDLTQRTLRIQADTGNGRTSPMFSFGGSTLRSSVNSSQGEEEWTTVVVEGGRKRRTVGRPRAMQVAAAAPGQRRLFPQVGPQPNTETPRNESNTRSTQ